MKFAKVVAMMMVLALAGLAVAAYHWRSNETIEKINIRGIHMLKEQEILNDAQIVPGGKLASADLNQMRLRLLQNPFISHAVVSRDRQALDIDVTERIPAARVDIDGILSFMDTAGVIFPQRIGLMMDVPIVYGVTKAIDGKEVIDTAAVQEVASVLRLARTSDEKITNTISVIRHLPTGEIQFETNGCAVPVRFGTPDDGKAKMRALREFLPQLFLHGEQHAGYIDVRFHDQIVVRWNDTQVIN